jgi:hypothetical protein
MALTTGVATEWPQNTKGMVHTCRLAWRFGGRRACMEIQEEIQVDFLHVNGHTCKN